MNILHKCPISLIIGALIFFTLLSYSVKSQVPNQQVKFTKDIVYKTVNGWQGRLDLYQPVKKAKNALVVYIHGGGWIHGKKEEEYDKIKVFIDNGFSVANVEYRLARQAAAPAAVEDVNCALVYLLMHARKYHIDTKKVIIMGASAGAHLALLVGLQGTGKPSPYNGECSYPKFKPAAIISKYGPTNLITWKAATSATSPFSQWLGDKRRDTSFVKAMSPIYYVNPTIKHIPILLVHGKKDHTVPFQQAVTFYQKLKSNGNPVEFHVVENGGHGRFAPKDDVLMNTAMVQFVKKCIAK
jgi:acetyl esterase/lipase